jgi:hypothetical protein
MASPSALSLLTSMIAISEARPWIIREYANVEPTARAPMTTILGGADVLTWRGAFFLCLCSVREKLCFSAGLF